MEPEIIFGETLRGSDSKKLRREVYETVEHINNVHPTKITKVVVYINGKGQYVTELWAGKYYSKQSVCAGGDVSAERGILYAHLRVSAKAIAKTRSNCVSSNISKTIPTLEDVIKSNMYILNQEQRDTRYKKPIMSRPISFATPAHGCICNGAIECFCGGRK